MAETTDATSQHLNDLNLSSNSLRDAAACHTLPLELWSIIYRFLQLDAEADILEFRGLLRKSEALEVIYITASKGQGAKWRGHLDSGKPVRTVWLNGVGMEVLKALNGVPEPRKLIFRDYLFQEPSTLHWVTAIPTVRSLKLLRCGILERDLSIPSSFTTDQLYSLVNLWKSNVNFLELGNSYQDGVELPRTLALLALIPSLETLTTTPRSFRTICGLPTTLDLPPLRNLTVASFFTASINQAHLLSFLRRCPTLETLHIGHQIRSKPLAPGELPIDMPSLRSYEGRPEYLTLVRAPALRRAAVKSLEWDEGALIHSLASTSTALDGVVLELTAIKDSPATESVKRWVEEAAARGSPSWQSTERFSVVIRISPLGEWIYSARVGRTDAGELFFEYHSRREESMAYLATSAS